MKSDKNGVGHPVFKPLFGRTFTDYQHLVRDIAAPEFVDRVGKDIESLFHNQPAKKADHRYIIGDTQRLAPLQVAAVGIEYFAIDATRPDADIIVHPLAPQHLGHRFRWRHQRIAAAVETTQYRFNHRFQKGEIIIAGISLETGVHRCQHRDILATGPGYHLVPDPVGARYLHDIGVEPLKILAHITGDAGWEAIFAAPGKGD